jgi:hypothetical protein
MLFGSSDDLSKSEKMLVTQHRHNSSRMNKLRAQTRKQAALLCLSHTDGSIREDLVSAINRLRVLLNICQLNMHKMSVANTT